jgi:hypothetical protein
VKWKSIVLACLSSLCMAVALADEVSISSESLEVSDDAVTTYRGDVTIRIPASKAVQISADKDSTQHGVRLLQGARVTFDNLLITAERATLSRTPAGETLLKSEQVESRALADK